MDETDVDPNYKRPTHIGELGLDHAPIQIHSALVNHIKTLTAGGTKDYHKAYDLIADYLEDSGRAPEELIFWFRKAAEINSNDKGAPSNASIRGGNAKAAEIDNRYMDEEIQQTLSNKIGLSVIDKVLKGSIPNLYTITQKDALETIQDISRQAKDLKIDLSNWVGSAWSWNIPVTIDGVTRTLGAHISSDPLSLEKFIKVQSAAAYAGLYKVNSLSEATEIMRMRNDPIMGPPEKIRQIIQKNIQTRWRRELPADANDPYAEIDFDSPVAPQKPTQPTQLDRPQSLNVTPPKTELAQKTSKISTPVQTVDDTNKIKPISPNLRPALQEGFKNTPNKVQLAKPRKKSNLSFVDTLLAKGPLPGKGPERVKRDPGYNPFNRDKNGFEDLDGEVYVWKKGKAIRNRMIREAGRVDFFGIDNNLDEDVA